MHLFLCVFFWTQVIICTVFVFSDLQFIKSGPSCTADSMIFLRLKCGFRAKAKCLDTAAALPRVDMIELQRDNACFLAADIASVQVTEKGLH